MAEVVEEGYVIVNDWYETAEQLHRKAVEQNPLQYEQLCSQTCFRLLKLKSSKLEEDTYCSLEQFEINAAPPYEALSYTWGRAKPTHALPIRNRSLIEQTEQVMYVHMTPSLANILSRLRDSDDDIWLWVDALCINQSSNDERNQQVKLMGTIYGKAFKVLANLDSCDVSSRIEKDALILFDFVRKAMHREKGEEAATSLAKYCQNIHPDAEESDPTRKRGVDPKWLTQWQCFLEMCQLTYWTRKWIIQELILARTVVLLYGSQELPMTSLEDMFGSLVTAGNPYGSDNSPSMPGSERERERARMHQWKSVFGALTTTQAAQLALHRYQTRYTAQTPHSLHELFPRYRDNGCEVPADHVYGLFNLLGEHRKHLVVDYSQTPLQRCKTVLEFLQLHDSIPAKETFPLTTLLMRLLKLKLHGSDIHESEAPATVMEITMRDQGAVVEEEEDETSIRTRQFASSLRHLQSPLELRKKDQAWSLSSNVSVPDHSQEPIGRRVLTYFHITGSKLYGLSDTKVLPGDRLWQPRHARLCFIVRGATSDKATIVGRAHLFETESNEGSISVVKPQRYVLDDELEHEGEEIRVMLGINQLICLVWLAASAGQASVED